MFLTCPFLSKIRINIIELVIWISCTQIQCYMYVFGLIVAIPGHIHLFLYEFETTF